MIVTLCERFHCLPSQLYAEDAEFIRQVRLTDTAREIERGGDDL
jgi:hypothetical protein